MKKIIHNKTGCVLKVSNRTAMENVRNGVYRYISAKEKKPRFVFVEYSGKNFNDGGLPMEEN